MSGFQVQIAATWQLMNPCTSVLRNKLQIPSAERFHINDKLLTQVLLNSVANEESGLRSEAGDGGGTDPKDLDDKLFPGRSKTPVPSPVHVSDLAGSHHDAGYGTLHLAERRDGNRTILSADCDEMVEQHGLRLYHVSGTFWSIHAVSSSNATEAYRAGEFTIGVDEKPMALEVRFSPSRGGS